MRSATADVLNGARIFLMYLRDAYLIPAAALSDAVQDPMLPSEFSNWMRQQRGTYATTLANDRRPIVHLRIVRSGGPNTEGNGTVTTPRATGTAL